MYEITIPKLNSNDLTYVLTDWFYADGDLVPPGVEVVMVETSKAAEGISCEVGGILLQDAKVANECRPGDVVARLFEDCAERDVFLAAGQTMTGTSPETEPTITEPAMQLIRQYGLDPAVLLNGSTRVISRADVQRLVDERASNGPRRHVLDRAQRAAAEMVTRAHQTIPAAHATVSIVLDDAIEALRLFSERIGIQVRVPELLIRVTAELFPRYPLFFASVHHDGEVTLATAARIGVTIDVGRGLTVPVVAGPDLMSLQAIADTLARFRETALRRRFREEDLSDSNIGISLPVGDVILVQPLIMPGHACMISLASPQVITDLDANGQLTGRRGSHVGLAYDHRLINGRDAAIFLGEVKRSFESAERLAKLVV